MDPLASFLLRLAAGIQVGQHGLCQIPLTESARMPECQLYAIADAINKKDDEVGEWPDERQYHREWAKDNCIPPWIESELWERKRGQRFL